MNECTLIFPHQLFDVHPALDRRRPILLVEDSLFFGDKHYPARFHRQKLILHRASMKAFETRVRRAGYQVHYEEYDGEQTAYDLVCRLAGEGVHRIYAVDPVDDLLGKRLRRGCRDTGMAWTVYASPMFLTPPDWADQVIGERKPYRMASFYMAQRRRMNVLMEGDRPVGGVWSFDDQNRKRWPKGGTPPRRADVPSNPWVREAESYVGRRFPKALGTDTAFLYPVTHEEALSWLACFLSERLIGFGTYEDAMVASGADLHHSMLTPMLNIGLLTPQQVLDAALEFSRNAEVPLNDLEGFVRQLIGWREFICVMYRKIGVRQRTHNFWKHEHRLPDAFYDGTTGMAPVDSVIRKALRTGYAHHIERLMVLGNVMLLCELHPDDVYRWFMELFVDAYDWVMVPNVYGMSQFADGGLICTKPYISGSNYIRKMSDYPAGPWCKIWDGLFWCFISQRRQFFEEQPRLSMMVRQWDRMLSSRRKEHLSNAETYLRLIR